MLRSKPVLLTKWLFSPNFAIVDSCTPDGAPSRFYSTTPHHLSCQVSPKEAFLPWVRIFFPSIVTWCSSYPFKTKESTEQLPCADLGHLGFNKLCQYVVTFSLGPSGCGLALYNHKEVIARFTCNMDLVRVCAGIWFEWKPRVYTPDWWICPSPQQWFLRFYRKCCNWGFISTCHGTGRKLWISYYKLGRMLKPFHQTILWLAANRKIMAYEFRNCSTCRCFMTTRTHSAYRKG